jgi:ABC-2 type transport system ATP-binding protein
MSATHEAVIEVENLVKEFNGITAVKGVSFSIAEGELFGFLGPNGAGKTTTINMLCTLLRPTSGRAVLNGYDVVKESDGVRQSIGLVFQDPSLDERLTARENLEFHAMIYDVKKEDRNRRIDEVLNLMELKKRENDEVRTFSGGMKRRLEIARGLLHYPKVLFLDEPTLGLDPQTRNHIWTYIRQLKKKESITIFLTTHYMGEAGNCSRIAIIDNGEIIALDSPENLKKQVGGDVITLRTADNKRAIDDLEKLGISAQEEQDGLHFEVENGEQFIPSFITSFKVPIEAISLRRPTLEDVFLKLTGHAIREETVGAVDRMREHVRVRRR